MGLYVTAILFHLNALLLALARSPRRWYPNRLSITSHGHRVELGRFLTNGEREALATALINAIEKNR